jgi:O-acetylserine/cysteine efflux transporter
MTRKDGLLALLVVVVWGLNFVVIKLGLHNMPPLMLAGLRFMLVAFPALLFVARPAIPLRLLLGYGLTISFGQFAFCSALSAWACLPGWRRWCCRRKPFHHHSRRLRLWRTLQGKQLAGIALAIFGVLVLVEASLGGEHVPLVGFMLTLAAALSWACGNIFNKKIMSQATRPPIMSLVVWSALIPVLPFMLASWLIDGPQPCWRVCAYRSADDSVAALSGVYRHYRRLWYLGLAAGAL